MSNIDDILVSYGSPTPNTGVSLTMHLDTSPTDAEILDLVERIMASDWVTSRLTDPLIDGINIIDFRNIATP